MNFNEYDVYRNVITRRRGFNPANSERNYTRLVFNFKPNDDWANCAIITASFFRSAAQIVTSTAGLNAELKAEFQIPAEFLSAHHKKIFVALQGSYTGENEEEITISTNQVCINLVSGIIVEERTSQRLYESLIALLNGKITSFLSTVSNIRSELIGLLNGKIDNANNAVKSNHIEPGAIKTSHIEPGAVTAEKLSLSYKEDVTEEIEGAIEEHFDLIVAPTMRSQNEALGNHNTRLNTVEQELGNKLDDETDAIETDHIQNGAVTAEKLAQSVLNTIDGKADKTDKVFKAAHMGVLMPALRGGFPDFSTTEKTLTLRQGTQLMLEGIESSEQVKELAPNGDTTIYCNSVSSSAIKIYYNLQDEEFNVLEYNGVPTANDILICAIRDVSRYSSPDNGISISCAYTIDGKLFGVNIADYITNGSIAESKLSPTYKQSVQTALSGKADKTNKVFKAELLGVLFPAIQNGLPNVDTANNTLTLPKGMSLLLVSTSGSSQTKALSPDDDVVISYPSTSSAVKIYYNLANEQFNTYTYDGVPSQNDVLICTIRDTSVYGISNNSMSISCPFTIDGKLFGINLADYIANNSITEAQLSTAYKQSVQKLIDEISSYASGINSNVNSLKKLSLFNLIKSATFEKGTLNNGVEAVSTTRIRSAFINISDVRSLQVSANSGYKYNLHFYDSNGTFVSSSFGNIYWHWVDWQTESYFIPILPAVKYVRIVISDTSNSENITLNDSSKIKVLADYSLYREFENVTNYCGKLQESIVSHNNWVNAVTDGGSGLDYSSTRICSGLIELPKSGIININTATGYEASYIVYNENMTRIKVTEYSTSCTAEIGNNYKWIVVFVKADSGSNVDISSSEGSNCTISYIPNVQLDDYAKDISVINSCVKSIAHRGLSDSAPENTLEAYRAAREAGFIYAETDVAFTSDDVPVLLHDSSINRTARNADGTALSSAVNISEITFAQSQNYDFGIWKGATFAGTKIPKFEDFIKLCRNIGMKPCIELKPNATTTAQVQSLVEIVRSCGMLSNVIWTSFAPTLLAAVKTEDETACLGLNVDGAVTSGYVSLVQSLQNGKNQVIMLGSVSATSTEINLCKSANIPFEVGVCDTVTAITALDPYISGIWSNKLHAGKVLYENSMT